MAGKRRFVGPSGGVFVPHETVDETTIRTLVESGEWTPVQDEKPKPATKRAQANKK